MSININHPSEDISTSSGNAPTLGGGAPSVNVMSTAAATATQYAKLATLSFPATNNVAANLNFILTPKSASGSYQPVIISATALQATTGLSTSSKINVLSTDGLAVAYNDLFLVTSASTNGTDIELYMQSIIAAVYDVQLLSYTLDTGISIAWNDGATWSATDPTSGAAVSVTSDWAGSSWVSPTLLNGWTTSASGIRYRKTANGFVNIFGRLIPGTETDATAIFSIPVGYRPKQTERHMCVTDVVGGGGGAFNLDSSTGTFAIYAADTGGTFYSVNIWYIAEN